MTNHSSLPRSINTLRSNVTEAVDEDLSPNGTTYYSADEQENRRRGTTTKRAINEEGDDDETQDISAFMLRRKQSKLEDPEDTPTPSRPTSTDSVRAATSNESQTFEYNVEEPDWTDRPNCWAFLQSCNSGLQNVYLKIRDKTEDNRSGYTIGRAEGSDIKYNLPFVSKTHCLLYMETGASGEQKGIRIYIEDKSSNGTFVNGEKLGFGNRRLLKGGDRIQLKYYKNRPEDHPSNRFYRVCFPPVFDAERCVEAFSFREVLGRGNFATVYRAINNKNGGEAAIKLMNKSRFEKKPKTLKSVINEMGIMMGLQKHPFLVKLERIFNEDKNVYLVLEYVKDGELFNYIRDKQKLTENETRFVFWQLFNAIKYLHDNAIAHRDLKPENVIMVDKSILHIKVSDFGLAKTMERNSTFDSQCGTPNYVAPEVLSNLEDRAYTYKCDMWSLGVMMFICLCGYPPFSEENGPPSMKEQIKNAKFEFLTPYWDGISTEAKDLIKGLLTVDPYDRLDCEEALDHKWMKLNPKDLDARKSKLSADALEQVEQKSVFPLATPTQACTQGSQLPSSY